MKDVFIVLGATLLLTAFLWSVIWITYWITDPQMHREHRLGWSDTACVEDTTKVAHCVTAPELLKWAAEHGR